MCLRCAVQELEVQIRRAAKGAVSHVEARGREQTRTHRRLLLLASARNAPARQRQAMQRVWEHRTLPREGASAVRLLAELEDLLGVLRTHRWRPTPAWAEVLSRLQMMDAATDLPPNLHWLYLVSLLPPSLERTGLTLARSTTSVCE